MRIYNYYKRNVARFVFRKPIPIRTRQPLISFTFDDFPRTALATGGAILNRYNVAGTYYICLGLLGTDSPSGRICKLDDLQEVRERGHELGCHTFSHCHSWDSEGIVFEDSVIQNRTALAGLLPGLEFQSFSYPISEPRPNTKRRVARHFLSSRAGGQTLNKGTVDLNLLSAYFLEKSLGRIGAVTDLIDQNHRERGWLIFATHDVADNPSVYGCTPEFLDQIVRYAVNSGARILPVVRAVEELRAAANSGEGNPVSESRR